MKYTLTKNFLIHFMVNILSMHRITIVSSSGDSLQKNKIVFFV